MMSRVLKRGDAQSKRADRRRLDMAEFDIGREGEPAADLDVDAVESALLLAGIGPYSMLGNVRSKIVKNSHLCPRIF